MSNALREREMSERDSEVSGRDFLIRSGVFLRKRSCYIFSPYFGILDTSYARDLTASRYSGDELDCQRLIGINYNYLRPIVTN